MKDKVLYNVLRTIKKDKCVGNSAPDSEYVQCLAYIGMIKVGWETYLTDFGEDILNSLKNKFEKW